MSVMKCFVAASLAVLAQSATKQPQTENEQRGNAAQKTTGCAFNCSGDLDDQLALLQVKSNVSIRQAAKSQPSPKTTTYGIYDLNDDPLKPNAVYHAVVSVQLEATDSNPNDIWFTLDMAPVAKVTKSKTRDPTFPDLFGVPAKAYLMLEADPEEGVMAGFQPAKMRDGEWTESNHRNEDLSITSGPNSGMTLGKLSTWWNKEPGYWSPSGYNCQTFAQEVMEQMARDEPAMNEAIGVLSHNSAEVAPGSWGKNAGVIANVAGIATGLFEDLLQDIGTDSKFKHVINAPILRAKLWFVTTDQTYGTTSKETRLADYDKRAANLRKFYGEWGYAED